MIALLQRVSQASVSVAGEMIGEIGPGLLALIGVEKGDTDQQASRLLQRVLGYRIFADTRDKMNLDVRSIHGGLLLVPQFTLAADTRKGTRPGFSHAAPLAESERLFSRLLELARRQHQPVAAGRFGADMQVALINDGPVTFWLQVSPETE